MGLFGKKKPDYRRGALITYLANTHHQAANVSELCQWGAWGVGGNRVLDGLKEVSGCDVEPDSVNQANLLLELCTQAMISIWYHNWESQESHPDEEKNMAREISLKNVQAFLYVESDVSLRLHKGFDKEFQMVMEHQRNTPYYYSDMFYQRFREIVTRETIVNWEKLNFPIDSQEHMISACNSDRYCVFKDPLRDSVAVWVAITSAGAFMFERFIGMRKEFAK